MRRGLLTIATAAAALTACGTARGATPAPAPGIYGTAAVNRAVARRQATALLRDLTPPAGATAVTTDPTASAELSTVPFEGAATNTIDAHAFYVTDASPSAAIAAVAARLPAGAGDEGSEGGVGPSGTTSESREWSLPTIAGVTDRLVAVSVSELSNGTTAVRLDGEAVWQTPRAGWERVPTAATSLTFTGHGPTSGSGLGLAGTAAVASRPVTITGRGAVRRIVAYLNGLEVFQPGVYSCPAGFDESTTVTFRGPGGRALARAVDQPSGCASIALTVGGRKGRPLADFAVGAGTTLTQQLAVVGAIGRCASSQLTFSVSEPQGGHDVLVSLTNRSRAICALWGYPTVQLTAASGRPLSGAQRHRSVSDPGVQDAARATILYPRGAGSFTITRGRCAGTPAAHARIALPDGGAPVSVSLTGLAEPLRACAGKLVLTPAATLR